MQENTVPVLGQNPKDWFLHRENGHPRILFVGNSITKHSPKPSIGWKNDCGMAASDATHDYVHLVEKALLENHPDASFAILQIARFEHNFLTMDIENEYREALDFNADAVLFFFGANVDKGYMEGLKPIEEFALGYERLRNTFAKNGAKLIHLQGFYIRDLLDAEKKKIAGKYGDRYVEIGDIRTRPETHGKYNHPSDQGMKEIADIVADAFEKALIYHLS